MVRLGAEEARNGLFAAVEHNADIFVARGPHIGEELSALLLGKRSKSVAQLVEGLAQRCTPLLVEAGLAAITAAVGAPALDAVTTAPRGVVDDLALVFRRKLRKEAGVVGEFYSLVCFKQTKRVGECHFAVPVMVAIGLAVSGDVVDQLCFPPRAEPWYGPVVECIGPDLHSPGHAARINRRDVGAAARVHHYGIEHLSSQYEAFKI